MITITRQKLETYHLQAILMIAWTNSVVLEREKSKLAAQRQQAEESNSL